MLKMYISSQNKLCNIRPKVSISALEFISYQACLCGPPAYNALSCCTDNDINPPQDSTVVALQPSAVGKERSSSKTNGSIKNQVLKPMTQLKSHVPQLKKSSAKSNHSTLRAAANGRSKFQFHVQDNATSLLTDYGNSFPLSKLYYEITHSQQKPKTALHLRVPRGKLDQNGEFITNHQT